MNNGRQTDELSKRTLVENDTIKAYLTGKDFDFIAIVENKTDKPIWVGFNENAVQEKIYNYEESVLEGCNGDLEKMYEELDGLTYQPELSFEIKPNNFVGILADPAGWTETELLEEGEFDTYDQDPYADTDCTGL